MLLIPAAPATWTILFHRFRARSLSIPLPFLCLFTSSPPGVLHLSVLTTPPLHRALLKSALSASVCLSLSTAPTLSPSRCLTDECDHTSPLPSVPQRSQGRVPAALASSRPQNLLTAELHGPPSLRRRLSSETFGAPCPPSSFSTPLRPPGACTSFFWLSILHRCQSFPWDTFNNSAAEEFRQGTQTSPRS